MAGQFRDTISPHLGQFPFGFIHRLKDQEKDFGEPTAGGSSRVAGRLTMAEAVLAA